MGKVVVNNTNQADECLASARWCEPPGARMRGFMFCRQAEPGDGLVLVQSVESLHNADIHRWFVFTVLAVYWIAQDIKIVDAHLALPWRIYMPPSPAQHVFEARPEVLCKVAIGDVLEFVDAK